MLVDENDRDVMRFLWFKDGNLQQQPIENRMRNHVFGAKSTTCCAAYVLQRTASDNLPSSTERVKNTCIYVDDLCLSYLSEQQIC